MPPRFSFAFKKESSLPQPTVAPKSTCSSLFDQSAGPLDNTVTSRSIITSLGSQGFESTYTESNVTEIQPIPCPVLLPEPTRDTVKKSNEAEYLPFRATKQRSENASREEVQGDESYGLLTVESNDEDEIGPPTTIPATERSDKSFLEAHRGVLSTRVMHREKKESFISYDDVPVENFGVAMLLGMGYDPNKPNQSQPLLLKSRIYTRAGLGADKEFEEHKKNVEAMSDQEVKRQKYRKK